jgi:Cu(I)/Ag(I) efflux system membrane fusion protein
MELVPVYKKSAESSSLSGPGDTTAAPAVPSAEKAPTEFTVPLVRQQQIGVRYSSVTRQPLRYDVRTVGLVAVDKQRRWSYVPRMEGYIQKLFVFSPGEMVQSNAPVLSLYSPDVFTAEKELVNALHMRAHSRTNNLPEEAASTEDLLTAARDRLRLWNVTDQQIAALEQDQKPREYFTLYSPFRGVVEDVAVDQGRKVMPGDRVVDLADLSVVWVWAQFYQDDLALLQPGLPVTITTAAYPGETFRGKISVVDPFLNDATRTVRARINVENNDFKLRPEMYVDVNLTVEMGNGLAVPVDAVLPTGLHNIAFVDRGEGRLEPRFVELGREYGSFYEVKGGLKEHDRIVTSANFLIDAEAKVEGALNSW